MESINDALRIIDNACSQFPEGELDKEHTITCEMPSDKVSFLIGKGGSFVQDVRITTKTQIHFHKNEASEETDCQTMAIQGRILDTYRAHAMMMRRYHSD